MNCFVFLTLLAVFVNFSNSFRIWHKSDLPQFRPKKKEEIVYTGPRNRVMDWKNSLAFEKVTKESDVFCRIYNLCSHYAYGLTAMNMLAKWKDTGMTFPYKKYDGRPDSSLPMKKLSNFVHTFHNARDHRNSPFY